MKPVWALVDGLQDRPYNRDLHTLELDMNIMQINTAILQSNFTNDQLTSIIDAIKFARARLTDMNKRTLRVGQRVSFTSSRTGTLMSGDVVKIAIKFVTVRTIAGLWRVPANMLSPVLEAELA